MTKALLVRNYLRDHKVTWGHIIPCEHTVSGNKPFLNRITYGDVTFNAGLGIHMTNPALILSVKNSFVVIKYLTDVTSPSTLKGLLEHAAGYQYGFYPCSDHNLNAIKFVEYDKLIVPEEDQ